MRALKMQNRELNLQIGDVRGRNSVVDHRLELRCDSGDEIADFGPFGGETALNLGTLVCIGHPSVGGEAQKWRIFICGQILERKKLKSVLNGAPNEHGLV